MKFVAAIVVLKFEFEAENLRVASVLCGAEADTIEDAEADLMDRALREHPTQEGWQGHRIQIHPLEEFLA